MNLLLTTTLLLISAVAVGFYLVFLVLRQRKRSPGLGLTHAGLALSGLIVLFTEQQRVRPYILHVKSLLSR